MSGIVFFNANDLEKCKDFYISRAGMDVWADQNDCIILKQGNMLLGFCRREKADLDGMITFFYENKEEVDRAYEKFKDAAETAPKLNERYRIYHFFARDPEGRAVEFQCFLHDLAPFMDGTELLLERRSVRTFADREIPENTLQHIFELCRFAPTSMNSQSYYFVLVRDQSKKEQLAALRGPNSAPIKKAPIAVAICSDSSVKGRSEQDACIAAYHFMIAARLFGLGTCWIAAMDREEAKEILGIPPEHQIATVTPLGFPETFPETPERKPAEDLLKYAD